MPTSARCADRSQARGLAGLRALELNQTPHLECKHCNRVAHCICTINNKGIERPLGGEARADRQDEDYPQELDVTFAPLGLFVCIAAGWFMLHAEVTLSA